MVCGMSRKSGRGGQWTYALPDAQLSGPNQIHVSENSSSIQGTECAVKQGLQTDQGPRHGKDHKEHENALGFCKL